MTAYKYQTKKGIRWEYLTNYVDYDGKKRQKHQQGFKTKKEALEAERVFLTTKKFDNETPLRAMVDIYRQRLTKHNSLHSFDVMIRKVEPLLDLPIASITETKAKDYLLSLAVSPISFNSYARWFCTFYNFCAKKCEVPNHISIHVQAPKKDYQIYTLDEYLRFSSHLPYVAKVFFDILYFTGMRKGEALALTKADVSDMISISKSKDDSGGITTPKTASSFRKVAIPAFLKAELDEYMEKLPQDELFPVNAFYFYKYQKRAEAAAGLHHIRIHDFRHSHASFLISKNVNIADISKRLGHSNIGITLSVYSHLYQNNESTIAKMIDSAVKNP